MPQLILCGDIGGTNTRLAVVEYAKTSPKILLTKVQQTKLIYNFSIFVNEALEFAKKEHNYDISQACFAVAGHVDGQKAKLTNASLSIDAEKIKKQTGLKTVFIINDFEAMAFSIPLMAGKSMKIIQRGKPSKKQIKAIIGAGTGLGKAILVASPDENIQVMPSEGGRADLPIQTQEELQLSEFIKQRRKKRSVLYEDVLSGRGLEDIYTFFHTIKYPSQHSSLPAATIFASRKQNPCSNKAINIFTNIYAKCCRNYAIETLCEGGLYVTGGIASKNPLSFSKEFIKEFINHEQLKLFLKKVPVYIVTNQAAGILGAAIAFLRQTDAAYLKKEKAGVYRNLMKIFKKTK